MKNALLIFVISVALASCKKSGVPADNGCISQAKIFHFNVSIPDSTAAAQLLNQNHLPTNDLEIEYIIQHDTITRDGSTNVYQYVYAFQYLKGLPIMSSDFGYEFKEGVFQKVSGTKYENIDLDTHPTQSLSHLRSSFIDQVRTNMGNSAAAALKDSCLETQFGYYDLNVRSTTTHTPNFVKAWIVRPANTLYAWPQVIFRDDDGTLIVYYGDKTVTLKAHI